MVPLRKFGLLRSHLIPRRVFRSFSNTSHAGRYQRRSDHVPNTQSQNETHYVLALKTDQAHHDTMTALRNRFFPPRLNKLSAHMALFRALPGTRMDEIVEDLTKFTTNFTSSSSPSISPFPIRADGVFRFKKGVAIHIDDGEKSRALYEALRNRWHGFLSQQDQSYLPHYTVANKLNGEEDVYRCFQSVTAAFEGSRGTVLGLALYRYDRGWWKDEKVFWFKENAAF